jgi:general stress protein 26
MSESFWRIVDSVEFPLLVTNGPDGFPRARPMTALDRDGGTLWFATSLRSAKVREIRADPRVVLLFVKTEQFNYATLHGRAEVMDDEERKRAYWRDDWKDDWPRGPFGEDYVLLKVTGERGSYYYGYTGEAEDVALSS